ncbi:unnamed protein product [Fusarium graminearum]|uniref:Chromosome 3, complete genome n=1 Tax=Gibberella zeae (strain ATCC MYA-4620 / CBS 123657 / FGSC 9075 / NRRL 31084 / PH-1) TaxID=229533 RepID=A0A098DYD2_GIBZE|nr:unnamed protein product [Fusarium graminearum]
MFLEEPPHSHLSEIVKMDSFSVSAPSSPVEEKQRYFPSANAVEPRIHIHEFGKYGTCQCAGCTGCNGDIYCISSQQCYKCYCKCAV